MTQYFLKGGHSYKMSLTIGISALFSELLHFKNMCKYVK